MDKRPAYYINEDNVCPKCGHKEFELITNELSVSELNRDGSIKTEKENSMFAYCRCLSCGSHYRVLVNGNKYKPITEYGLYLHNLFGDEIKNEMRGTKSIDVKNPFYD